MGNEPKLPDPSSLDDLSVEEFKELVTFLIEKLRLQTEEIDRLKRLLGKDSSNSHIPPGQAPPQRRRRICLGTSSDEGAKFVSGVMSAAATLRRRGESLFDFLCELLQNHYDGLPPPSLLASR
jgi:hypothetical protein